MAVQGGLLASLVARQQEHERTLSHTAWIVCVFLLGKTGAYTLLGFVLGWMGSLFQITASARVILMVVASLFMIVTALNLLHVHPMFRYITIKPPRFLYNVARKQSKMRDWFAPLVVGMLTIFLPCGTTQAMMVTALQYGNPIVSASILLVFTLGTIPVFVLFGLVLHAASTVLTNYFVPIAATLIIGLSLWNISNAAALAGYDTHRVVRSVMCQIVYCDDFVGRVTDTKNETTTTPVITIKATSYEIDHPYITAGSHITLTIKNIRGGGCIQFFTIPKLNIQKHVPVGQEAVIEFTAPTETGVLPFMCSMGMYRGSFIVQ